MNRLQLITGAVLLSLVATAIPLTAMFLLSKRRAVETQQRHLTDYGQWTIQRANITLQEAVESLHEIEAAGYTDCTPEHIAAMQKAAVNSLAFNEMGFYQGDHLACTSWGKAENFVARRPPQFITPEGLAVHLHVHPRISHGQPMLGFEYGAHNVLVDPERMVDVLVDNQMSLALANDKGQVVATLNEPDAVVLQHAIQSSGPGEMGDLLYSSYRVPGWIAVAIERRNYTEEDFAHQRATLLPIGLLISGIMVAIILWALRRRLSPVADLQIAIKRREFLPYYQPIMELETGKCVGAEALIRWRRPDGQIIGPGMFLPLAEESGLILEITDQLIERIVDEMQDLLRADPEFHISVNLAPPDIISGRPLPIIQKLLADRGISTPSLWLEVTESGFIQPDNARTHLAMAREMGHSISIDDFGTGYSSLALLSSLPLDTLKIDKSFVDAIGTEAATSAVTGHIIGMAAELRLDVIAEGVETEAQAEYLRSHRVRYVQGWLYGKAMPRDEFLAFYAERR